MCNINYKTGSSEQNKIPPNLLIFENITNTNLIFIYYTLNNRVSNPSL